MQEEWLVEWVVAVTVERELKEEMDRRNEEQQRAWSEGYDRHWEAVERVRELKGRILKEYGVDPEVYLRRQTSERPTPV